MALLVNKTLLSEFKLNDKDAQSEASESGTSNSVTSTEDLQKLAIILGLSNPEDVYQERFRVDRRRLENMLAENLEENKTAQYFFHRIMTETGTLINWPARLKIGARSKKDPHVRVAGRPDDVRLARERIMQLLDTRSNRVTMKIDVSYTDHSHIIGKSGLTIKRVMEETGCHIHFPDSNRNSALEKSNQVSIAGDMERVERARARVRALTPLVFCFELPVGGASYSLPDLNSPYVQQIQEQYNVQVMIRTRPKLHATLLVVKGVQWEVQATMEATTLLINYMCGPLASQTQVQMSLEISTGHHGVVAGRNGEQLKAISKGTNTQVMFPDAADPNIPMIKRSCVTITGAIKDVYAARQQLVGSLPLVVIFDVSDETQRMEQNMLEQLMHKYNVYIIARRKPKQGITSFIIKGIERCAGDIYEARRELLGGKEPTITAEIPETYQLPAISANLHNFGVFNTYSPNNINNSSCAPMNMMNFPINDYANIGSPMFAPNPPTPGGYPSPMSPVVTPVFANTWLVHSPQSRNQPFAYPASVANQNVVYSQSQTNGSWNPMSTTNPMGRAQLPAAAPPTQQDSRPTTLNQLLNISSQASSGYQSNFTGSSASLDVHSTSGGEGNSSNMASPSVSPISKTNSPTPSNEADRSQQDYCVKKQTDLAHIISELPLSERRAVGCEKKTLASIQAKLSPVADYKALEAEARKAMQEEIGSGYRLPTSRWAGYYFSNTSPSALDLRGNDQTPMCTPERVWNKSAGLVRPNIIETAASPSPPPPNNSPRTPHTPHKPSAHFQRVYELLTKYHLDKYIDTFKEHEVDIMTFPTLTEHDLKEIGVRAIGARRKMMLMINELRKDQKADGIDADYNQRPDKWTQ